MVAGGRRPSSRKLWHLYRWSYSAGIQPPSAMRDEVAVSVVLQRESDQARSRTIHNHDRSCVWQQGLTLRRRQQNRIELYALVNPKLNKNKKTALDATKLTTDRQEASRGLFATAELLVSQTQSQPMVVGSRAFLWNWTLNLNIRRCSNCRSFYCLASSGTYHCYVLHQYY